MNLRRSLPSLFGFPMFIFVAALIGGFLLVAQPAFADYDYDYADYLTIQPSLTGSASNPEAFSDLGIQETNSPSPADAMVLFVFNTDTGGEISNSGWSIPNDMFGDSILAMISNCYDAPCIGTSNQGGNNFISDYGSIDYPITLLFGKNDDAWGNCADEDETTLSECAANMEADNSLEMMTIGSINQYQSDGETVLPENGITTSNSVVLQGPLFSTSTDDLELQVELEDSSTTFNGTPTVTSDEVAPGDTASVTLSDLPDGFYHWQSRIVATNTSTTSTTENGE